MKALQVSIMGLCLTGFLACAQNSKTPKQVLDSFSEKFPTAKYVKWDKENETEWEAEFKMDGIKYSANFDTDGAWKETEHKVKSSEVPEQIKTALTTAFPDSKIEDIEVSDTKSGRFYEFMIEKGETDMEIVIDSKGNIVKKEMKDEEDSDND
ncbi:hypothetical protein GCM10007962_18840 [Yeosuana aromativorans]|uniref:Putative beta-lactamase-inhibitor-like PepSY-like domain-containing protein n=1 Tax=Yeosuana aromativorans TaxID=288019 RepID=A0A8J3BP00_9FLAO|nr:PepSY-like domain-containing protein [Yeosuana aromativorans]GGK24831.1 hypothetical protein GCM10007962_18840 [Yeosuana aromativorans]